ncbi:hypothetical protein HDU82_006376 [Entophlyctis luteolus]|nr:hypothetical protein HDU82_006376 [Entophlyctis luteolus]
MAANIPRIYARLDAARNAPFTEAVRALPALGPVDLAVVAVMLQCRPLAGADHIRLAAVAAAVFSANPKILAAAACACAAPAASVYEKWLFAACLLASDSHQNPHIDLLSRVTPAQLLAVSLGGLSADLESSSFIARMDELHLWLHTELGRCLIFPAVFAIDDSGTPGVVIDMLYDEPTVNEAIQAMVEIFDVPTVDEQLALVELEFPDFLPPPPLEIPDLNEYVWLSSDVSIHSSFGVHPVDPVNVAKAEEVARTLKLALEKPLRSGELKKLTNLAEECPNFMVRYGAGVISPEELPALVEINPTVATEVIKSLLLKPSAADEFSK